MADKDDKKPKRTTAQDVPGRGLARRAGRSLESRRSRLEAALAAATGRRRENQTTDSNN